MPLEEVINRCNSFYDPENPEGISAQWLKIENWMLGIGSEKNHFVKSGFQSFIAKKFKNLNFDLKLKVASTLVIFASEAGNREFSVIWSPVDSIPSL